MLLDKTDDWKDPSTPAELTPIAKPEYIRGTNGDKAKPVSHTWDQKMTAWLHVKVDPPDCDPEDGIFIGTSNLPHVSFKSERIKFSGGLISLFVEATAPLPKQIDVIDNASVQWSAQTDQRTISNSGGSTHEIYVTAGDPRTAPSWPMAANSNPSTGVPVNHNFFTAFRMKHAATKAKGKSALHDIVQALWNSYGLAYDLNANGFMNPWNLAVAGTTAQCMTICGFLQSAAGMLGLQGDLVYVRPTFDEPPNSPGLTKSYNAGAKAWAVASTSFVPTRRQVTAPPHSSKTKHHKYSSFEVISMIDNAGAPSNWTPGWNNYEATFRFDDGTTAKYYGGGGSVENSPTETLNAVLFDRGLEL